MFIETLAQNPGFAITWIGIVMFSICLHEYAHAAVALKLGDDTAASEGHLTLNPMVQMGMMSMIFLVLIGIAWGSVPVDERRLRGKYGPAIVAAAGPLSNLMLCAIFGVLAGICAMVLGPMHLAVQFFFIGSMLNGALMILNLIPIPPLDGFTVAGGFFPNLRNLSPVVVQNLTWVLLILFVSGAFGFIFAGGEALADFFMDKTMLVFALFS